MRQTTKKHPHWPKGVPLALRVPQVTLNHYVQTAALRYPDKPALIYCRRHVSYGELQASVAALAAWLQQQAGVKRGDRVLLMSQNSPEFVIAYFATLLAGAAIVPVNPMSTVQEVQYYAQDSGARVAFVAQDLLPAVQPLLQSAGGDLLDTVVVHTYAAALSAEGVEELPTAMRYAPQPLAAPDMHSFADALQRQGSLQDTGTGPDDMAVLPYTSGTTGHPKGCHHTHSTMLASSVGSQVWRNLNVDSVFLAVAPLFHMLGMQNGMNMPLTLGATIVLMPRWDAARAVELVERHGVTAWTAPPAMVLEFFARPEAQTRDLSSLALLSGGGAAMPESVAAMLAERFGLGYNEAYGLTETAAFLHANPLHRGKRQCLGIPTQGVESRIIDPATLQELPQGEVGELVTRGAQVMKGYWRNEAANRAAFVELDGKLFFRTGDLAMVDEEGYFFMRDRLKRMINFSGYKVWPAEVEAIMYEHPAVYEACIVATPDAKRGESVLALIVLKPEYEGDVTEQQIIDWARQRMAVYKAPRDIRFVDELPKSGTGKIMWRELQEREYERATSSGNSSKAVGA